MSVHPPQEPGCLGIAMPVTSEGGNGLQHRAVQSAMVVAKIVVLDVSVSETLDVGVATERPSVIISHICPDQFAHLKHTEPAHV